MMLNAKVSFSLTASLAIRGDWGYAPTKRFPILPAGKNLEIVHLYIQMPCFANLRVISFSQLWRVKHGILIYQTDIGKMESLSETDQCAMFRRQNTWGNKDRLLLGHSF